MSETSERTKTCRMCGVLNPLSGFPRDRRARDGRHARCRQCFNAVLRDLAKQERGRARLRRARLIRRGVNPSELDGVPLTPPPGTRCGICGTDTPGGQGSFHLDHDHATGRLRSWCCSRCNVGLGSMKDSPTVLAGAIRYLHRHGKALSSDDLASLLQLDTS